MADFRANGDSNSLTNGKEYATPQEFIDSVDNSAWDFATACSSCHVGGGLTNHDREGTRYSKRPTFQGDTTVPLNAYDYTVYEYWMGPADMAANPTDPLYANGMPAHYVNDMGMNNHLNSDGSFVDTDTNPATYKAPGFAPTLAPWAYPYPLDMDGDGEYTTVGVDMPNFQMPNVREIDCMFCHMEGYNNIVSSVAVQMGALNAAPAMGSGMMNMFTQSYLPNIVDSMDVPNIMTGQGTMKVAVLSGNTVSRIKGNPPSDNCRLCHSPTTMENFSDMFDKFLAASPMEFNPLSPFAGPTGLAMPGYDLNAAFIDPSMASQSPTVYAQMDGSWVYGDGSDAGGPFAGMFPMALFQTYKNVTPLSQMSGEMGGNNQPMSGPIYFNGGLDYDQSALKKATIPFPRADFFKRGDLFDDSAQVEAHHSLTCASCHMDTNATNKDQCDPGRGYARLGGVESGTNAVDKTGQDSRNTAKRCEHCHITGKNAEGLPIETYGAGNPTAAHAAAGLTAKITNAIGAEGPFMGDHLDIIDCTVCHMKKQSMAVRALDCTSGNRYPTMIGFQQEKGMMAMFTDPMGLKDIPEADFQTITGLPFPKNMYVNEMNDWSTMPQYDLLKGWWQNGPKFLADGVTPNPDYRRKIYNINMITAILWDNNGAFDANGDGATGVEADSQAPAGMLGFDPWIQRDLKTGPTFADTGFAVVPIGFGDPMDAGNPYGSVYSSQTANGFNPMSDWDYVGVYGGNTMFNTPEQINAYQAFRTGMDSMAGGNKPWDQTQLTIFGGPFQVTHNVVSPSVAVLGTSCNDCHDANSHFFSGGYDMTGSAVPTADTVDMTGIYDINQANGGMVIDISGYNMMQRPVVDYEIVAEPADIITGAEAQSKAGTVHEVEFEEHGCWDGSTFIAYTAATEADLTCLAADAHYVRTTDLSRAEFLYFDEADAHAKATALEANRTLSDYVNAPVAAIDASVPASVEVGATINLVADTTGNDAANTYSWTVNDEAGVLTGSTVTKTFNTIGTWTVTLKVINASGDVDQVSQQVQVAAPAPAADIAVDSPSGLDNSVTFSNLPAHTMLYIIWGDGARERVYDTAASVSVPHNFSASSRYFDGSNYNYRTTVYVYNGSTRVDIKREILTIAP
ncbi:PKD domain-containing protein [Malonomonas rubra DSM 5091]|uniref:PKD domain-containing protein n=1 Tax=Malonomonas rubra DSM 5091 TaxID=1122189 RepID=A0A1M6DTJ3_MALRU|nr:PKD domain-containing protein [Malonomonas rubra]SHI76505.1 PKD domain-containing protein [Malonomonas rubra DSM 5091]